MKSAKNVLHALMLLLILLSACAAPAAPANNAEVPSQPLSLDILHLNNTNSYVIPHDVMLHLAGTDILAVAGGWSVLASAVQDIRSREKNVMLLHAGDMIEGTIWTTAFGGMADVDAMNLLQFDAMALGSHELSKGPVEAAALIHESRVDAAAAIIPAMTKPARPTGTLVSIKNGSIFSGSFATVPIAGSGLNL